MNMLRSALLWTAGTLFFVFSFTLLSIGLFMLSRKRVFALGRFLFRIQTRIMGIRLTVTGLEHIDPRQTYLIMGNHQSLFDLFVIPAAIPLTYVAVEAAYHFSIPLWGSLVTRWGCIPIHRRNIEKAKQSLDIARKRLHSGASIIILPEGHRTLTGHLGPFKKALFTWPTKPGPTFYPLPSAACMNTIAKGRFN